MYKQHRGIEEIGAASVGYVVAGLFFNTSAVLRRRWSDVDTDAVKDRGAIEDAGLLTDWDRSLYDGH